jgi:hypothetical protein
MSALTILIIRHAEKPEESWPGPGLKPEGLPDGKSLVIGAGSARAPGRPCSAPDSAAMFSRSPPRFMAPIRMQPPAPTRAGVRLKQSRRSRLA